MRTESKFVWVEDSDIDADGEWLHVIRQHPSEMILCERNDPYTKDVWVHESQVIKQTSQVIF